ncbi:hypothetical protein [Novosphingobium pentaromativorans]|uniref:Uncharacterized protein n=1 Tax=Novosphingobium pentaromativorans US6-1 TaxID=1088721 RepID=G6E7I6_9SPHN|nr:hypothetical protein [Novosphingobium pentaromativorans]AIT81610.1 hypothetical protein JI59_18495 [Novosphingobium pentaromativorans US6-1]EHJ62809.1 hypothetical protein NSU_0321 [Novosphingobium pentaromativorans US6-1]
MTEDDGILSFDDACAIGMKVAEMADRVKVGHKVLPGTQAKWGFTMDGVRFEVVVTVANGDDG